MSVLLLGLVGTALTVYSYLILARAVGSFFIRDWSRGIPRFLFEVTEPALAVVRRFIPPISGLDFSPMVLFFGLSILGNWLSRAY